MVVVDFSHDITYFLREAIVMSISAYVFIECAPRAARDVVKEAMKIQGVKRANSTTGPYDVIALIEAPDINTLGNVIVTELQGLPGVRRTQTNVISD